MPAVDEIAVGPSSPRNVETSAAPRPSRSSSRSRRCRVLAERRQRRRRTRAGRRRDRRALERQLARAKSIRASEHKRFEPKSRRPASVAAAAARRCRWSSSRETRADATAAAPAVKLQRATPRGGCGDQPFRWRDVADLARRHPRALVMLIVADEIEAAGSSRTAAAACVSPPVPYPPT